MKKLLIILLVICLPLVSYCQSVGNDKITVNKLSVGSSLSLQQLINALGQPTKIRQPEYTDSYENAYHLEYGEDCFYWIGGEFYGFDLWTSAFAVNGLVRVGDNIAKVDMLGGVKRGGGTGVNRYINWRPAKGGLYEWTSVNFYYNEQDIIISIDAFINDL